MITKKNITKVFFFFIFFHLFIWTLVPSISNINLPLDTIEALAWGSNIDWGFSKHPPLSAFAVEVFFTIFGSNDWAYYLLSQIFVIIAFIYVWKLSNEIFEEKIYSLLSILALSGIYFYNFTTPEFNVNISQLPFWALTVYYFWKGIN
ncbi:glycosyltransferase family 39 protein, partial [Candidatus Pelagibacter bacterium]|nr:glycosyltransferase family 39 protein [Candidatus Pelagibacter bacterium]